MRLSLAPLRSARVLLSAIALLLAFLLYLGWSTFGELERQRSSPVDSAQWTLYQTNMEFQRLSAAYAAYRLQGTPEALKEFTSRFDIFYSRVEALKSGRAVAPLRSEAFFAHGMELMAGFTGRLARMIDSNRIGALRTDSAFQQEFNEVESYVAVFVTSAVQAQAARNEQSRNSLKRLLTMQLATSGLVMLAFAGFAAIVLRQRNRARKGALALRESRDLLSATIKSSLDGVLIADAKGKIADINDAAAQMFGHAPGDMLGHEMSGLIMPERLREAHKAGMARYAATGKAKVIGRRIEIDAMRRDGTEFPIELSISTTGEGEQARYIAFLRDITERRVTEQSLKKAKEDAESANRAKAQFLAAISHEMRTPLTGILGALDLIGAAEELPGQQQRHLRTANRSGHALLSVINDVLDISRLEDGKVELNVEEVDLGEIVQDVVEIIGRLAEERENAISVMIDGRLRRKLTGDPARIRQVLLNLATNAAKFTRCGEIEISVMQLGGTGGRVEVEFSVRDTGPGIAEGDREKLFKNFSRLQNAAGTSGGSGLGLAISKRLVDLMSGTIGVESTLGAGSRFWFRLPLATAAAAKGVAEESAAPPVARQVAPRRILVVDDNETVRSIVADQLAASGHRADTADNAVKAVAMLSAGEHDAVILDISMPVIDGFEALRIIRGLEGRGGQTPAIALTAHALAEVRERCAAAGFDHFLTKPVRGEELAAAIAAVTSGEPAPRKLPQAPARPEPPLFDLDGLREQFTSVAPANVHRIVERFGAELDQQLSLISGEGSEISPHHLRRIVHVLAGSSSMIGAQRLATLAGRLDALASAHQDAELTAAIDELAEAIRLTRAAVEKAKSELAMAGA